MKHPTAGLSRGQLILTQLFGALIFVVGLWLMVGIVTEILYGYWRTRAMVTAEAQLRSVVYEPGSGGGGGRGGGGPRPSTVVRYDYRVEGRSFTGSRIAVFKTSEDFYASLSSAFQSSTPIHVFIDPQHPEYAVIDREFAWWPIIAMVPLSLVGTGFGFLILWHYLIPWHYFFRNPNT